MRARLFWKLGLTYLILVSGVLAAFALYAGRLVRTDFIHAAEAQLVSLDRLAQKDPPPFQDPAALANWAAWMAQSGARVTIVEANGAVLADSVGNPKTAENHLEEPEIQRAFSSGEGRSTRHSATVDRDLVYRAVRYSTGTGEPVIVRMALPLDQVDAAVSEIHRRLFEASLLILAIGAGISLLFSRAFSLRVERLKDFAARVSHGDFRPLPAERTDDELTQLSSSLNETAARLEATIRSLTEERNRSSAILRSMVEGVAVMDSREYVTFCNQAFAAVLNRTREDCEGRPLLEVTRHSELLTAIRKALAAGEIVRGELVMGTAKPHSFSVTVAPVETLDSAGEAKPLAPAPNSRGAVVVLHDITEQRRLERVRQDFVANVSHEFKTPLTAIQGFAETLLTGALEDKDHNRTFVEIIRDHALRLDRLTNDLLRLARIEAGQLSLEHRPISLGDLFESCATTSSIRAKEKRLSLMIHCPADLPLVLGDASLLREVLQNLFDNAIQYTPAGGEIRVAAEVRGREAVVTVADTGIGIPLADRERIFERFYRVDAARSREAGGTGLGLSISKHIVEAHGGRIWVESQVGQGSRFHFSVPLAA